MTRTHKAARALRIVCGMGLVLMGFLWVTIIALLIGPFASGGIEGVRAKLHHIFTMGQMMGNMTPTLTAVSGGYEALIFYLLLTWALREGYGFAGKLLNRSSV